METDEPTLQEELEAYLQQVKQDRLDLMEEVDGPGPTLVLPDDDLPHFFGRY